MIPSGSGHALDRPLMQNEVPSRRELLLGLAVALVLRFGFAAYSFDGKQIFGSFYDYERLGLNLLAHGMYTITPPTPTAIREPGYPLFIAGLYALPGHSPWALLAGQSVLSAATVYLVYLLGVLVFDRRVGRLAFWMACFYPYFIYYAAFIFRETLLAFLASAAFFLLARYGSAPAGAVGGGIAGFMCLANTATGPLTAAMGAFLAFGAGRPRRWKGFLAFSLVAAGMLGAWVIRNAVVMRAFVPTSTCLGVEMYTSFTVPYEIRGTDAQNAILGRPGDDTEYQRFALLPEVESNRAFRDASLKMAWDRPMWFAKDCVGRFFGIWRIVPRDRAYTHNTSMVRLLALGSDGWLLPLAVCGLILGWGRPWVRWMGAFLLVLTLSFSISQAVIRYRVTVMPFVLILAARGGLWILDLRKPHGRPDPALS
ncbi:MAG: glycosyltransferase family 39 protein [Elusimicrobia bacterium]|nr:glycosyltransferase family 39 protein [Elusimicrobiota bacterium]